MAHRATAPALQRAQRLLQQWVRPNVTTGSVSFTVEASAELFEPVAFENVATLRLTPFRIGSTWGKPWHTVWFKLSATVPDHAAGLPIVAAIDLGFSGRGDGFQVEGMAWLEGRRVHAVQPDRRLVPLGTRRAGELVELWVEAAATPIIAGHAFGYAPTPLGDPLTAGDGHLYALKRADLAVHQAKTEELAGVLHSMIDLIVDSEENAPQRARLFDLFDTVADVIDVRAIESTAPAALEVIRAHAARWALSTTHEITAVGHAHLDTAWLWPIRETRRKAVRTFANAVHLLEKNPDAVFCHSQAQHYSWVREDAPEIFDKVVHFVEEGRWEPVGGMWVETDLNLPSGESIIRQYLQGRSAFAEWFGEERIARSGGGAFLPDDFGYPGTLPQIIRHCEGEWFFTQKLSWNESNRFPHHSFWWEGIDGSRVFAHFSPVETYNALLTPSQLRFAERNFADHVGASKSLVLYGHGDGGGGPTQQMIDRVHTASWWSELPRVSFGTIAGFFEDAMAEYAERAPTWVGEMYLEKHRGTYSSQLSTKNGNRRCERLLHEWELWASARCSESSESAAERVDAWRRVLTQQFHDIIPGSSIAWVHQDTRDEHRAVAEIVNHHIDQIIGAPSSEGARDLDTTEQTSAIVLANPSPVAVSGVEWIGGTPRWVEIPAMSMARVPESSGAHADALPDDVTPVCVSSGVDGSIVISNGLVELAIDSSGSISNIFDIQRDRALLCSAGFAGLEIRRDRPAEYDAWDIDRADADSPGIALAARGPASVEMHGDLAAAAHVQYAHGSSQFTLTLTLRAGEPGVDFRLDAEWLERETRLQFVLPADVLAREALCGIQFGHVRRPRHSNTTWDSAMFEVCAHRYVRVSEPGFGVALVADGPRGYDVRGDALKITLLRSPSFPDPHCDEGPQSVEWGLRVDDGHDVAHLERDAARRAHPIRIVHGEPDLLTVPVRCEIPGVLVSAVKPAHDGSGDIVVRLWETRGARASGVVAINSPGDGSKSIESVARASGLENAEDELEVRRDSGGSPCVEVDMRPFEITTLRIGYSE